MILQFRIKLSRINVGIWILCDFFITISFSEGHLKHEFLLNNVRKLSSCLTLRLRPEDQLVNPVTEIMSVCSENKTKQILSVGKMRGDSMLKQVVHIEATALYRLWLKTYLRT